MKGIAAARADLARIHALASEIQAAAEVSGVEACLIAAVVSRETRGDPACGGPGAPRFSGDHGHGHGPMQLDDRYYPVQCRAYRAGALTDAQIMAFCAALLKRLILAFPGDLHSAIAAYNEGAGGARKAQASTGDADSGTTGHDYAKDVQERLEFFREVGF